jgi:hypothetical protein
MLISTPGQPTPKADAETESATLVARGKDFMVHALGGKQPGAKPLELYLDTLVPSNEVILVHTSLATGKMRVLVRSASASWKGPAMAIDRYYYSEAGVQNFRADKERLYVLRYSYFTESHWRPSKAGVSSNTEYTLLVFHLESGREILSRELKRPEKEAGKKDDKATLQPCENGVEAFGTRYEFKGTELIKPAPESKK